MNLDDTSQTPLRRKRRTLLEDHPPLFMEISDVERIYGLRRGRLYTLIHQGVISSVLDITPGCKHGKRLIYAPSVDEYLMDLMMEQEFEREESKEQNKDYLAS